MSKTGVKGDAARATQEKGEQFLEAAIEGLIELVRELKSVELPPWIIVGRVIRHSTTTDSDRS